MFLFLSRHLKTSTLCLREHVCPACVVLQVRQAEMEAARLAREKEEEEAKQAAQQAKKEKEAQKKAIKKERQKLRTTCKVRETCLENNRR